MIGETSVHVFIALRVTVMSCHYAFAYFLVMKAFGFVEIVAGGLMDKALDYESGGPGFESHRRHIRFSVVPFSNVLYTHCWDPRL